MSPLAPPTSAGTTVRRVLVVALLALIAAAAHYWYGNRHQFYDLRIYWEAVRWWAGGHELYSYAKPDPVQGPLGFTYPPFAALLMRPLAALPFGAVAAIFCTLSALALVFTLCWLLAPVADRHGQPRWLLVAVAVPLASWLEPIRETFTFGQVNLVLVLLIAADVLVAVPRGSRLAGVGIGLAAAIKLTPAIFIGYLLLTRRGRAGLTATATAVAVTLLAAAVSWSQSWRFWTAAIWDTQRIGHTERVANQSLLGLIARLATPAPPNRLLWAALVVTVVGYGLWRARRAWMSGDEVAGLTLAALTGALISPVTWSHHLFWFAPVLVIMLDVAFTADAGTRGYRRALLALATVIYATVTVSVIAWYEWGLSRRYEHGLFGFFTDNWYVLLMVALLVVLPSRGAGRPVVSDHQTHDNQAHDNRTDLATPAQT